MTEIEPLSLERGDPLVVEDKDSRYDGTEGRVLEVYEDKINLELDVWAGCGKLAREFDLEQLSHSED